LRARERDVSIPEGDRTREVLVGEVRSMRFAIQRIQVRSAQPWRCRRRGFRRRRGCSDCTPMLRAGLDGASAPRDTCGRGCRGRGVRPRNDCRRARGIRALVLRGFRWRGRGGSLCSSRLQSGLRDFQTFRGVAPVEKSARQRRQTASSACPRSNAYQRRRDSPDDRAVVLSKPLNRPGSLRSSREQRFQPVGARCSRRAQRSRRTIEQIVVHGRAFPELSE